MFVSFDLNYAEIPEKYFPREANCQKWISELKSCDLYESAESSYKPEAGDIVFFDRDEDGKSDHVGIITAVTGSKIKTIEGNSDKGVRRRDYDRDDEDLFGYCNPAIVSWLKKYGGNIDKDNYALSQLLQWMWRSRLRDGKDISIYLPSQRMRELLENWLTA